MKNPTHTHTKPYPALTHTHPQKWARLFETQREHLLVQQTSYFYDNSWWTSNWRSIISRLSSIEFVLFVLASISLWGYHQKWQPKWHQPSPHVCTQIWTWRDLCYSEYLSAFHGICQAEMNMLALKPGYIYYSMLLCTTTSDQKFRSINIKLSQLIHGIPPTFTIELF